MLNADMSKDCQYHKHTHAHAHSSFTAISR